MPTFHWAPTMCQTLYGALYYIISFIVYNFCKVADTVFILLMKKLNLTKIKQLT